MTERFITAREQWLQSAIDATRDFIAVERAENDYDLMAASPDSSDYGTAADSKACLQFSEATLSALETEIIEVRRRSELRRRS